MAVSGPNLLNKFRPTALSFNSYGWKGSPQYNRADVPSQWVEGVTSADRTVIEQQLAYEWLNSSEAGGPGNIWINPPFLSGAAGRLMPGLVTQNGTPARILRGFIRRAEAEIGDIPSMSRLYFMYNPETITRDYVSYLDQGALDPFNTVYQSGNLVAPPSYMDFTFSLFFDRQEEAVIASNPGVLVDYQYFDMVVRNVIPATDPNTSSNGSLPDNGVMMINPRDITVVFSPQMTVQGRPSNARISFTKFTHRMVPTRMQIDLTMRVVYFGPLKDMVPYVKDEAAVQATIPWSMTVDNTFEITNQDLVDYRREFESYLLNLANTKTPEVGSDGGPLSTTDAESRNTAEGSSKINSDVVDYAKQRTLADHTQYNNGGGRVNTSATLWISCDCSGLVYSAFAWLDRRYAESLKWLGVGLDVKSGYPSTAWIWEHYRNGGTEGTPGQLLWDVTGKKTSDERADAMGDKMRNLQKGDLLIRYGIDRDGDGDPDNHIAFFDYWDGGKKPDEYIGDGSPLWIVDAATTNMVGSRKIQFKALWEDYNCCFRPLPAGGGSVGNAPPTDTRGPH